MNFFRKSEAASASTGEIAPQLAAARQAHDAARVAYGQAVTGYDESLTEASEQASLAAAVVRDRAKIALDRAAALVASLEAAYTAAAAREAEAQRVKNYDAALAKTAKAVAAIERDYPRLVELTHGLLSTIAEADIATAQVNEDLPEGRVRIVSSERQVRGMGTIEEKVLSDSIESLWCFDHSGDPIPSDRQGDVVNRDLAGPGTGSLPGPTTDSSWNRVVLRKCRVREIQKATSGGYIPTLASSIVLPELKPGHLRPWDHHRNSSQATGVLEHIRAYKAFKPDPNRNKPEVKIEVTPVVDVASRQVDQST